MALTNYGNRCILRGSSRNASQILLDGPTLQDAEREAREERNWILGLRARSTIEGGGLEVNACVADIVWGVGGITHTTRITVWPEAVIQLPSTTVRVEIKWDPDLPATYTLPTQVEVAGTIQHSAATPQSVARYIRWLPRILSNGSPELANIPIPAFADAVRPYGDQLTTVGYSSDLLWSFLPGGTVRSGLNLATVAEGGNEYEFGAGLTAVSGNLNLTNFGGAPLTVPGTWGLDWRIRL